MKGLKVNIMNYKYFVVLLREFLIENNIKADEVLSKPKRISITKLVDVGNSKTTCYALYFDNKATAMSIEEIKTLLKEGK